MEVFPREDRRPPASREYFRMDNTNLRIGHDIVLGRGGAIARHDDKYVDTALADVFNAAHAKPKVMK
jgi:hypothetical protein